MSKVELKRIMHVDDDADIREITKLALETIGNYTVSSFESGTEALKAIQAFSPELILLDVSMPIMSGPDVLRALTTMPAAQGIPVVFMTATAQRNAEPSLKELGATGFIEKPFDPVALPDQLAFIWRQHARSQQP